MHKYEIRFLKIKTPEGYIDYRYSCEIFDKDDGFTFEVIKGKILTPKVIFMEKYKQQKKLEFIKYSKTFHRKVKLQSLENE